MKDRTERLQKFLARSGVASRRKSEELITAGRVKVNGRVVTELGTKVDPRHDIVKVDGRRVMPEETVVLAVYKPVEVITSLDDPQERRTILDILPDLGVRVYPVGRLDYHSEGLVLMTNDGQLTHALLHPSHSVPRVYEVKIKGHPTEEDLEAWRKGIELEDGKTRPAEVFVLKVLRKNTWLQFTVYEGRNRLVRRMCDARGYPVLRLKRTAFGPIKLGTLRPGKFRYLNSKEITKLRKKAGLK